MRFRRGENQFPLSKSMQPSGIRFTRDVELSLKLVLYSREEKRK